MQHIYNTNNNYKPHSWKKHLMGIIKMHELFTLHALLDWALSCLFTMNIILFMFIVYRFKSFLKLQKLNVCDKINFNKYYLVSKFNLIA